MNGIVTFTVATDRLPPGTKSQLDNHVDALGFKTIIPCSEGGDLSLPDGTYACLLDIENQHEQLRHFYRSLVAVMRKLEVRGKYFINMANDPVSNICGEL